MQLFFVLLIKKMRKALAGFISLVVVFAVCSVQIKAQTKPIVKIQTDYGDIRLQLYPEKTPKTVINFLGLVEQKKYDKNIFHRVIPNFMIQGGDYENYNGTGGQSIWGEPFEDEIVADLTHERGVISMANAGANTNGSQFFITQRPTPHLDGKHTVFGKVIEGMSVVDAIAAVPTSSADRPLEPVYMTILLEGTEDHQTFTDQAQIPPWAMEGVLNFLEQGVIRGNEDGSFAPDRPVNRAELAKIIVLAKGLEIVEINETHFSDVPADSWFHPYVETIYEQGWIDGYEDGTFGPEKTINRVELAKIVANAFDLQEKGEGELSFFDGRGEDWFYDYVKKVYQNEVMTHNGLGYFYPGELLNRARTVKIVYDAQQK